MNMCDSCMYAQWELEVYHSSKECGLPGSSERPIFIGCDKQDEIDPFAEKSLERCEDVNECDKYEEYHE